MYTVLDGYYYIELSKIVKPFLTLSMFRQLFSAFLCKYYVNLRTRYWSDLVKFYEILWQKVTFVYIMNNVM